MSTALYHEALVAKARAGIGKGRLSDATMSARVDNPLCGDRVTIDLKVEDGHVTAIGHEVKGCLLCEAAASVIAELVPGKSPAEIAELTTEITGLMKNGTTPAETAFAIFTPVHAAKSRRDCVLLPFAALTKALGS